MPLLAASIVDAFVHIVGLGLLSGAAAGAVAFLHRWYTRERVPSGLAVLAGVGAVGIWLGTWRTLQPFILDGSQDMLTFTNALITVVSFLVAGLTALGSVRVGDWAATDMVALTGGTGTDDVSRLVQTVGRVVTVTLPEHIDDMDGHDTVSSERKAEIAGSSFVFPRGLTVTELRDRIVSRLKDDYGVGHVDIDLTDDGRIDYLALGGRVVGLGPLLAPGTVAVAVRADPAFSAGIGDSVAVWRHDADDDDTDDSAPTRVTTGEIRGVVGDVVTLAVDEAEATKLDATHRYRLVTFPVESRPEQVFATRLRSADETMAVVTVSPRSGLVGVPVGGLDMTVVAVRPDGDPVEVLPPRSRVLEPGDALYAVVQPTRLREIEHAADATVEGITPDLI
ncbi:TrkA C-terminal domain-containing protein [Haladaptatus sp. DYF46]|uniref:TrkA C-terminal domain-containing protein n=1 Tax=Haladaptatus sp. DYF46 TaxID=2886041 RepID=UPI001E4C43B4|nr:TrkA C-terminal domain-containing protein [Haladaptatus sp. DYF46]